jgi:hypothetical protein
MRRALLEAVRDTPPMTPSALPRLLAIFSARFLRRARFGAIFSARSSRRDLLGAIFWA